MSANTAFPSSLAHTDMLNPTPAAPMLQPSNTPGMQPTLLQLPPPLRRRPNTLQGLLISTQPALVTQEVERVISAVSNVLSFVNINPTKFTNKYSATASNRNSRRGCNCST